MGHNGEPMATPSNCILKVLLKMKNDYFVESCRTFLKLSRSRVETHGVLSSDSIKQIFMNSLRAMLVKNEVMSRLAIKQSEFCRIISLAKWNESLTLYSLEFKSLSTGKKALLSYTWVPQWLKQLVEKQGSYQYLFYGFLRDHNGLQVDYQLGVIYSRDPH